LISNEIRQFILERKEIGFKRFDTYGLAIEQFGEQHQRLIQRLLDEVYQERGQFVPAQPTERTTTQAQQQAQALSVLAIRMAFIGLFIFPVVLGPLAVWLGVRANRVDHSPRSVAAIVLGAVDVLLGILGIILISTIWSAL